MRSLLLCAALLSGCTCGKDLPSGADGGGVDALSGDVFVERPADVEQVWTDAKDGDEAELARLADREGPMGLVERSTDPRYRLTALRAMGYTEGWVALPALGNAAKTGPVEEATAATVSATALAAQKRKQVDPEDALELREGCDRLLEAAKDAARPKPVRVGSVRALRMLTDSGCIKASDIPTDVDVK